MASSYYAEQRNQWMAEKQKKPGLLYDPVKQSHQLTLDHLPTCELLNERRIKFYFVWNTEDLEFSLLTAAQPVP